MFIGNKKCRIYAACGVSQTPNKSYKYEEVFMEKNENEELLEQSPADIQQEDTQEIAKSGEEEPDTEEQKVSNGRFILWTEK